MRKITLAASCASLACALSALGGEVAWDLHSEWSERNNPNGAWSYREGANALPHVDWWQQNLGGWARPQPGWAESQDGNNRLPFWFKSNGTELFENDIPTGAVTVHSTDDANGVGNGVASVAWTSPFRGRIDISGSAWMGRNIGRSNDWKLSIDGTPISSGSMFDGDPWSSANPFLFELGSGGAAALDDVKVCTGSEVKLEIVRTTMSGEFTVVNLTITQVVEFGPCQSDLNGDCTVDGADLGLLLGDWGSRNSTADVNGDATVDGADLGLLLGAWGDCPEA